MKILLGLQLSYDEDDDKIIQSIESVYNVNGHYPIFDVVSTVTNTHNSLTIKKDEKQYDAIIIQEHISEARSFTIKDLDIITDNYDGNIVYLLGEESSKDSNLFKELFSLGIYNALKDDDAQIKEIVKLSIQGRTKSEAKSYYQIDMLQKPVNDRLGLSHVIKDSLIKKIIEILEKADDDDLEETYLDIFNNYEYRQNVFIVSRMNDELQERLKGIEEFDKLMATLKIPQENMLSTQGKGSQEADKKEVEIRYIPKVEKKIERYSDVPDDYKKAILLIGDYGIGTTFITSCLAQYYSERHETVVLDMDQQYYDQFFHLTYGNDTNNLAMLIGQNVNVMQLFNKNLIGYRANKNLMVYTEYYKRMKGCTPNSKDVIELVDILKKKNKILLIDMPIYMEKEHIKELKLLVDNIVVIVDQDICRLERIADRLGNLDIDHFDFVVNRYSHMVKRYREKNIGNLFTNSNLQFNRSFTVCNENEVNKAIASPELYLSSFSNRFKEDISNIGDYYYRKTKKSKKFGFWRKDY